MQAPPKDPSNYPPWCAHWGSLFDQPRAALAADVVEDMGAAVVIARQSKGRPKAVERHPMFGSSADGATTCGSRPNSRSCSKASAPDRHSRGGDGGDSPAEAGVAVGELACERPFGRALRCGNVHHARMLAFRRSNCGAAPASVDMLDSGLGATI